MPEPAVHLVVATPCYGGQLTTAYFTSCLKLQRACRERGLGLTFLMAGEDALITRARQDLTARFMAQPSATHLLFIDADIGFEPGQVFRLLDFGADVTAAAYPLKRVHWQRVGELAAQRPERLEPASLSYVFQLLTPPEVRDDFARVNYAGTGFLMARRAALEALARRHPQLRYGGEGFHYAFFDCLIEGGAFLPEDYSFCKRWTDGGGEIWLDLRSRLDHVGPVTFHGDLSAHPALSETPRGDA
ncbi:MAG TPA: hypothetical protein VFR02_00565 [bacterium]|nr:hypothetical protein [bacterium]